MIPALDCPCDTGPEVCCDSIFLKADRIRTVAWNAVRECSDDGCCATVTGNTYTTLDPEIPDPFGDAVIVAWLGITPVAETGSHTAQISAHRCDFRVAIRASGWPMLDVSSGRPTVPSATQYNNATKHAIGHAEKAYRALMNATQRNTLWASTPGVIFKGTRVSQARPYGPRSHIAGATFNVTVDITL